MRHFTFIAAVFVLFSGCAKEPESSKLLDQLVVSTNYDPQAPFSSYATYAIPSDTIGLVSNAVQDTLLVHGMNSEYPRPVLAAINRNLENIGLTKVDRNANPDIGVNVIVVNDFNVFQQVIYPGGGFGFPGNYYSGYYGYGSWYYYPFVNTYTYNTGVLIIELVDLKNKTPDNQVKVVWTAYLGDVYSTIELERQSTEAIDQAFVQSPYLQNQ